VNTIIQFILTIKITRWYIGSIVPVGDTGAVLLPGGTLVRQSVSPCELIEYLAVLWTASASENVAANAAELPFSPE